MPAWQANDLQCAAGQAALAALAVAVAAVVVVEAGEVSL